MTTSLRLAIFATHPIQYQVPWFRDLSCQRNLEVRVFFGMMPDARQQGEGFDEAFEWDIPLDTGYDWRLLENRAKLPSLANFRGISARLSDIWRELRSWKPDAALITGWNAEFLLQAMLVARLSGVKTLMRGDSNGLRHRSRIKRFAHRMLFGGIDRFLHVGKLNRDFYLASGVAETRLLFCPHFVDNHRLRQQHRDLAPLRTELRRGWGIPEDSFCCLFVGKFVERKYPGDLLEAFTRLKEEGVSDVHLLMIGSGELAALMKEKVRNDQLPVSFGGFLNQMEIVRAYAATDLLILPSGEEETWGLVVNEAMACGLPVVVSDKVGCHADLVRQGETGYVFRHGDVSELSRWIKSLAENPGLCHSMGKRAESLVFDQYDMGNATRNVLNAVNKLADGAHARC